MEKKVGTYIRGNYNITNAYYVNLERRYATLRGWKRYRSNIKSRQTQDLRPIRSLPKANVLINTTGNVPEMPQPDVLLDVIEKYEYDNRNDPRVFELKRKREEGKKRQDIFRGKKKEKIQKIPKEVKVKVKVRTEAEYNNELNDIITLVTKISELKTNIELEENKIKELKKRLLELLT